MPVTPHAHLCPKCHITANCTDRECAIPAAVPRLCYVCERTYRRLHVRQSASP